MDQTALDNTAGDTDHMLINQTKIDKCSSYVLEQLNTVLSLSSRNHYKYGLHMFSINDAHGKKCDTLISTNLHVERCGVQLHHEL